MLLWIVLFVLVAGCVWQAWMLQRSQEKIAALQRQLIDAETEARHQHGIQAQVMQSSKLTSLGQMVTGVAHEINAPLGFVKNNVEVIGDMLDDYRKLVQRYDAAVQYCLQPVDLIFGADKSSLDKLVTHVEEARRKLFEARTNVENSPLLGDARDLLADAGEGLDQLSGLLANLRSFSQADSGSMDSVDLNESLENALMLANHQLRDRIKVVKSLEELPLVRCVPVQMNQAFLNLITNAAQAIKSEGTLSIATKPVGNNVEISIGDTGHGIPDDILPKIFDPFFTTRPAGEASGLGLSIVHRIVKEHGGTIKVKTTPQKGTVFQITLPASNVGVPAQRPAAQVA